MVAMLPAAFFDLFLRRISTSAIASVSECHYPFIDIVYFIRNKLNGWKLFISLEDYFKLLSLNCVNEINNVIIIRE